MQFIDALWSKHGLFLVFVVWPIVSMVLNAALRKKTPEQWVAFASKNPRAAAIIRFLRAAGLDPNKAIQALVALVKGASDEAHLANPKAAKIVDALVADPAPTDPPTKS